MTRRQKPGVRPSHERWLVSYADFITLLFAFFVVLYSSSQVDRRKVGKLAMAIQVAFQQLGIFQESAGRVPLNPDPTAPVTQAHFDQSLDRAAAFGHITLPMTPDPVAAGGRGGDSDVHRMMQTLEQALAPEIAKQEVRLRAGPDGIVLSLQEVGFYDPGSDALRPGAQDFLHRLLPILLAYGVRLRIEGHTDNVPIHNVRFASNWELSTARATNLVRLFIDRYKLSPSRLSAAGYAEFHPVATNDTLDGRRLNRRIDIVILTADKQDPPAESRNVTSSPQAPNRSALASPTSGLVTGVLSPSR
jgi:chemotaxis protein MotB